jgi:putative endonuclease
MKTAKQLSGKNGEKLAEAFLKKKGYKKLFRNVRVGRGEIDLIMKDSEQIVFVEVKTRKFNKIYSIYDSISYTKSEKLIETCEEWLYKYNLERSEWRIDFVGVLLKRGDYEIIHLESAIA